MDNTQKPLDSILELSNGCSPSVGKMILEQYQSIPFVVRDALDEFYEAMDNITDKDSIQTMQEVLTRLRDACEANPSYNELYETAQKEAQEAIADVIANEGMSIFDAD